MLNCNILRYSITALANMLRLLQTQNSDLLWTVNSSIPETPKTYTTVIPTVVEVFANGSLNINTTQNATQVNETNSNITNNGTSTDTSQDGELDLSQVEIMGIPMYAFIGLIVSSVLLIIVVAVLIVAYIRVIRKKKLRDQVQKFPQALDQTIDAPNLIHNELNQQSPSQQESVDFESQMEKTATPNQPVDIFPAKIDDDIRIENIEDTPVDIGFEVKYEELRPEARFKADPRAQKRVENKISANMMFLLGSPDETTNASTYQNNNTFFYGGDQR
ncbi:hypothetical protein FGO68_gene9204 [Halteria grandinella]|uniref:Uncharacterized protein n=1 Tax=Halteria grandinella TaxID=5974 RepID=A0A8J8SZS6_HALGN|nr:hypothetical protein FGO68_gene9204 [Halteria grandinella]